MKRLEYYTASWCGPCKMVKPMVAKLKKEGLDIEIIEIDSSKKSESLATKNEVNSVPTFILYDGNKQVGRISGAGVCEQDIRNWLA